MLANIEDSQSSLPICKTLQYSVIQYKCNLRSVFPPFAEIKVKKCFIKNILVPLSIKHEASVLTSSRGGRRWFLDHTEMPLGADYRLGGVRGGFHWPLTCSAGEVQEGEGEAVGAVDREGNGMKRFAFRASGRVQFCCALSVRTKRKWRRCLLWQAASCRQQAAAVKYWSGVCSELLATCGKCCMFRQPH